MIVTSEPIDGVVRDDQHHRACDVADIHLAAVGQRLHGIAEIAGTGNYVGMLAHFSRHRPVIRRSKRGSKFDRISPGLRDGANTIEAAISQLL
jgi:hypothetical protein